MQREDVDHSRGRPWTSSIGTHNDASGLCLLDYFSALMLLFADSDSTWPEKPALQSQQFPHRKSELIPENKAG